MSSYDAVFIGSGINALVGAALLSRAGWQVCVLERNPWLGGAIRTTEATVPGYRHDLFSCWHPLFTGGPAYGELESELTARGVVYRNTDVPAAAALPDGNTAVLSRDPDANIAEFDVLAHGDGRAWQREMRHFSTAAELAFGLLGTELWSRQGARLAASTARQRGARGSLALGAEFLEPTRSWLTRTFSSREVPALLAPWVLHNGLGADDTASGVVNKVIASALVQGGCPVPEGGGSRLVEALAGIIREGGGELHTDTAVERVLTARGRAAGVTTDSGEKIGARSAVLASVTPQALYLDLLDGAPLPGGVRQAARRFRYGLADMQIHLALREPPRWTDERLARVPIVHVGPGLDGMTRARGEATRGLLPAEPTIVCGQPTALDPSRAPDGGAILWIQLQEMPPQPRGDAAGKLDTDGTWTEDLRERYADRVVDLLGSHITNLDSATLARTVISPADLAAANPNLVGGDPYAGSCQLDQFFVWRPLPGHPGHETPVKGLYHIGASTHPGPGLAGASGYLAAHELLRPTARERAVGLASSLQSRLRR